MPEPFIGTWASGERIDISLVPLSITPEYATGVEVMQPYAAANGGIFDAIYRYRERASSGRWVYELARVVESFPPTPPQIQGFSDERRIPMWTVAEEIAQRRKEWAEVLIAR